ncbi:hypothetical protein HY375_01705 [Candidatus Berkelbacteria bacterium]|nr:hypothetical protein [Candidatus Berkelbacteria bacterium]
MKRYFSTVTVTVTVLLAMAMVLVLLGTNPVQAKETPPRSGFWDFKWILGGWDDWKKVGVKAMLLVGVPAEYHPDDSWNFDDPNTGLPQGLQLRLITVGDSVRKEIDGDGAEFVVHMNNDGAPGWTEVGRWPTTFVDTTIDLSGRKPGPLIIRAYLDAGDHDEDSYELLGRWIIPREQVFRAMGMEPPARPGDAILPQGTLTGTVLVTLEGGSIAEGWVSVYWDDPNTPAADWLKIISRPVLGPTYFEQVPAGRVTIRIYDPTGTQWEVPGPEALLFPELRPGGMAEIRIRRVKTTGGPTASTGGGGVR